MLFRSRLRVFHGQVLGFDKCLLPKALAKASSQRLDGDICELKKTRIQRQKLNRDETRQRHRDRGEGCRRKQG